MPVGPLVSAGGSIIGGLLGQNAAGTAAKAEEQSTQAAIQAQEGEFNTLQSNLAPYRNLGTSVLPTLSSLFGIGTGGPGSPTAMSALTNLPGYQFTTQQGTQALEHGQAARGLLLSGNQVQAAQQFGQGNAQTFYGNYVNQLMQLAGMGQSAAAGIGQGALQTGQGISQNLLAGGQAAASGIVGGTNALTGSISSGLSNAFLLNALNSGNSGSNSSNPWGFLSGFINPSGGGSQGGSANPF